MSTAPLKIEDLGRDGLLFLIRRFGFGSPGITQQDLATARWFDLRAEEVRCAEASRRAADAYRRASAAVDAA